MNTTRAQNAVTWLKLTTRCLKSAVNRREPGQAETLRQLAADLENGLVELERAMQEPPRRWWQIWGRG